MRLGPRWHSSLKESVTKKLVNKFTYLGTVPNTRKRQMSPIQRVFVVKHKENAVQVTTGASKNLQIV